MMPVGAKWELYVPSDRAYGDDGYGDDIASGSTLVFGGGAPEDQAICLVRFLGLEKSSGCSGSERGQLFRGFRHRDF
jgi:hypothetical protein